jgi:HAD superfamily hydrolase (TIGR01549 family)
VIRAAIFDIDGTLVDSVDLHARSWQVAFEKFGKSLPFDVIRRQIGKGADQLLPVFFSPWELEEFGRDLEQYRSELFKRDYLSRVKSFPGVRALFQKIASDGKRLALASSAKEDELAAYKKIAQIDDLIETETSSGDVDKSKPHPDVFAAALKRLGAMGPDEALVVGDTPYDAEAAGKLKLPVIGLLCGGWSEAELRQAGCVAVYRDPAELLSRYDDSPFAQRTA